MAFTMREISSSNTHKSLEDECRILNECLLKDENLRSRCYDCNILTHNGNYIISSGKYEIIFCCEKHYDLREQCNVLNKRLVGDSNHITRCRDCDTLTHKGRYMLSSDKTKVIFCCLYHYNRRIEERREQRVVVMRLQRTGFI